MRYTFSLHIFVTDERTDGRTNGRTKHHLDKNGSRWSQWIRSTYHCDKLVTPTQVINWPLITWNKCDVGTSSSGMLKLFWYLKKNVCWSRSRKRAQWAYQGVTSVISTSFSRKKPAALSAKNSSWKSVKLTSGSMNLSSKQFIDKSFLWTVYSSGKNSNDKNAHFQFEK